MSVDVLTGTDTITINGRNITDLANNDVIVVEYPNEIAGLTTGKDGNTIFMDSPQGRNANVTLRLILGSEDDSFLSLLEDGQDNDFSSFALLTAKFTKRLGDGKGNIKKMTWDLDGGVFVKRQDGRDNTDLEAEQGVVIYNLRFARCKRTIG